MGISTWFKTLSRKKNGSKKMAREVQETEKSQQSTINLTRPILEEERELVAVIASAILVGDHTDSLVQVKKITGIDTEKEIAATIAAAIAAEDYPHSSFRLHKIEEITEEKEGV